QRELEKINYDASNNVVLKELNEEQGHDIISSTCEETSQRNHIENCNDLPNAHPSSKLTKEFENIKFEDEKNNDSASFGSLIQIRQRLPVSNFVHSRDVGKNYNRSQSTASQKHDVDVQLSVRSQSKFSQQECPKSSFSVQSGRSELEGQSLYSQKHEHENSLYPGLTEEEIENQMSGKRVGNLAKIKLFVLFYFVKNFSIPVHDKKGAWLQTDLLRQILELDGNNNGVIDMEFGIHPYSKFKVFWNLMMASE
ncbi:hypothetical protein HK096_008582, partial [Nowakowskiella sp. JEL0078]